MTAIPLRMTPGDGWHEAVVNVRDLEAAKAFYLKVAGWIVETEGTCGADAARFVGLGPAQHSGRFCIVRSPDHHQCWLRLVAWEGAAQEVIRPHAQAWDTGGHFSIMTRSADLDTNLAAAEALGWQAYNRPYAFGFSGLELRNMVLRGPDGLNMAVYQWVKPSLDTPAPPGSPYEWVNSELQSVPPKGAISKPFNAMQMVRDIGAATAFYRDVLGFDVMQEGQFLDPEPTMTNFALPINLSTEIPRAYAILIPKGASTTEGRVELMQFVGFEGQDLSARAGLTGLGIAELRFPVADLGAAHEAALLAGAQITDGPRSLDLAPFGPARAFTMISPDGAHLTYFEMV